MIEKTDFPYTLGGYVEQQNYKGFDIAVSIRRYKGISAYVISSEKRLIREESAPCRQRRHVPLGTRSG